MPDILHINVSSYSEKKKSLKKENKNKIKLKNIFINLDFKGELQYYRCEDLIKAFKTEYGLSQIKLLILSTQNIKEMKRFFNNIGIKNIIYIENKITYPKPNEQEEKFIKELYKNIIIEKFSIQESFNKSKGKITGDSISVEIFPFGKKGKFS